MSADPPFDHFGGLSLTLLARSSNTWNKQHKPKLIISPHPGGKPGSGSVYLFFLIFFYNPQYTEKTAKGEGKQKEHSSLLLASHTSGNSMDRGPPPTTHPKRRKRLWGGLSSGWFVKASYFHNIFIQSAPPFEPGLGSCCQPTPAHRQSQRLGALQADHENQTTRCSRQLIGESM